MKWLLVLFVLLGVLSIGGIIFHSIFSSMAGPHQQVHIQLISVWLSTIQLFYAVQAIIVLREKVANNTFSTRDGRHNLALILKRIYFAAVAIVCFLISLGYTIAERSSSAIWAALASFTNAVILVYLFWLTRTEESKKKYMNMNYPKATNSISDFHYNPISRDEYYNEDENEDEEVKYLQSALNRSKERINERDSDEDEEDDNEPDLYFSPYKKKKVNCRKTKRCCFSCWKGINITLLVIVFIVLVFLSNGALFLASGVIMYGIKGELVTTWLEKEKPLRLHVLCSESKTSNNNPIFPTIWIDVGGNHHIGDFFGVQEELVKANRSFCIYVPPCPQPTMIKGVLTPTPRINCS